jgi:hypothetical protein
VRVRKRKRRRRRGRWLTLALPLVLVALVAVGLAGLALVRDAISVRSSLLSVQQDLEQVRAAAGEVEADAAAEALSRAERELVDARRRTNGPLWSLASAVPIAGDSIEATRGVVGVASAMVDIADRAVTEGGELLGGGLDVQVDDGQLDLGPLLEARQLLAGLPLERLSTARDRLAASDPRWAPEEVLAGRRDSLALADDTLATISSGRELLAALPGFLGAEGTRRYFLGVQTPAELRGTGGLIGYYAVLEADGGRLRLDGSDVYDTFDDLEDEAPPTTTNIGQLRGDRSDQVPVSDEFDVRYGHTAAAGFFSNVNVDPDLPTTAEIALDLFERATGSGSTAWCSSTRWPWSASSSRSASTSRCRPPRRPPTSPRPSPRRTSPSSR